MFNEVRYEDKILTDKAIETTSTITASNIVTSATGTAGAFAVNGLLSVTGSAAIKGTLTATGTVVVASAGFTVGTATGPTILYGTVTGGVAPTTVAPLGSLFINAGGTGPASRLFVNATGATLWVPFTTAA